MKVVLQPTDIAHPNQMGNLDIAEIKELVSLIVNYGAKMVEFEYKFKGVYYDIFQNEYVIEVEPKIDEPEIEEAGWDE